MNYSLNNLNRDFSPILPHANQRQRVQKNEGQKKRMNTSTHTEEEEKILLIIKKESTPAHPHATGALASLGGVGRLLALVRPEEAVGAEVLLGPDAHLTLDRLRPAEREHDRHGLESADLYAPVTGRLIGEEGGGRSKEIK